MRDTELAREFYRRAQAIYDGLGEELRSLYMEIHLAGTHPVEEAIPMLARVLEFEGLPEVSRQTVYLITASRLEGEALLEETEEAYEKLVGVEAGDVVSRARLLRKYAMFLCRKVGDPGRAADRFAEAVCLLRTRSCSTRHPRRVRFRPSPAGVVGAGAPSRVDPPGATCYITCGRDGRVV